MGCTAAEVGARIALVMSGGTEGGLSPHFLVLARREGPAAGEGRALAIGTAFTPEFRPEEIGRMAQVEATAAAVVRPWPGRGSPTPPTCISCR